MFVMIMMMPNVRVLPVSENILQCCGEKRNIGFFLKGIVKWQDFQEQKQKL